MMACHTERVYPAGRVILREVGLRDDLHLTKSFPSSEAKADWIRREHAGDVRHFEVGSFLPASRFPQFADVRHKVVAGRHGSAWTVLARPNHALAAVSAALVAVDFAAVAAAVFYRYLLGAPLNGVDELTGYLVVAIASCGLGSAFLLDQHIGVDILTASTGPGGPPRA